MSADTSYSANVQWDDESPLLAPDDGGAHETPEEKNESVSSHHEMRRRFVPCYASVCDAGSTRGIAVSEVRYGNK